MSDKIDPKHPIENWRFEVVVDEQDLFNLIRASGKFSMKSMLASLTWQGAFRTFEWEKAFPDPNMSLRQIGHLLQLIN
jgi:hypothetical protein